MSGIFIVGSFLSLQALSFAGQKCGEFVAGFFYKSKQDRELEILAEMRAEMRQIHADISVMLEYDILEDSEEHVIIQKKKSI